MDSLHDRLAALQDTAVHTNQLIDHLTGFDFRSKRHVDTREGAAAATALSVEIGQVLRAQEDELELLGEEVLDVKGGREGSGVEQSRKRLKEGVVRLEGELRSYQTSFRRAQIVAKRRLADAQRAEREMILASYDEPPEDQNDDGNDDDDNTDNDDDDDNNSRQDHDAEKPHYRGHTEKESALTQEDRKNVSASENVTQALRDMHAQMAEELSKSQFAHETLEETTFMMKSLGESYDSLGSILAASASLVGMLMRSQKSDTWYLKTSFYIMVATLAWLIFRRWLYGPLWWLVWLPLRLLLGVSIKTGKAIVSSSSSSRDVDKAASVGGPVTTGGVEGLPEEIPTLPHEREGGDKVAEWVQDVIKDIPQDEPQTVDESVDKTADMEKDEL